MAAHAAVRHFPPSRGKMQRGDWRSGACIIHHTLPVAAVAVADVLLLPLLVPTSVPNPFSISIHPIHPPPRFFFSLINHDSIQLPTKQPPARLSRSRIAVSPDSLVYSFGSNASSLFFSPDCKSRYVLCLRVLLVLLRCLLLASLWRTPPSPLSSWAPPPLCWGSPRRTTPGQSFGARSSPRPPRVDCAVLKAARRPLLAIRDWGARVLPPLPGPSSDPATGRGRLVRSGGKTSVGAAPIVQRASRAGSCHAQRCPVLSCCSNLRRRPGCSCRTNGPPCPCHCPPNRFPIHRPLASCFPASAKQPSTCHCETRPQADSANPINCCAVKTSPKWVMKMLSIWLSSPSRPSGTRVSLLSQPVHWRLLR